MCTGGRPRRASPRFAAPDGLHALDIVARRYGARPAALAGLTSYADAALAAGDLELADRWRHAAYCLDETCAVVGMRRENEARAAAEAHAAEPEPEPATLSRGVLKGKVPYRPQDCPPWLEALFPEGPAPRRTPLDALI